MSILYCDCFSGISGDMFLAALLDAGLPVEHLTAMLRQLHLPEFEAAHARRVHKGAIQATLLEFDIHQTNKPSVGHHHHAPQRNLPEILSLIENSGLPEPVQATSRNVFSRLAAAESKVHGCPVEEIHFHEVGATDSILDIVGAAVGLHYFDVTAVYSSPLPLGTGQVQTQHGPLPLPAPATLELLRSAGAPLVPSAASKELVTPTGAAILATLATFSQPAMTLQRVGVGAGQRDLDWPNILRVMVGVRDADEDTHVELETNIDDMNPQLFSTTMARLFAAGALDVFFTPIYMKKNRPATRVSVIVRQADEDRLAQILLRETTTLGVRARSLRRHEAGREMRRVSTRWGEVSVKVKLLDGVAIQATPEYDECVQVAEKHDVPVAQVMQEVAVVCAQLGLSG